jgi:hypothetical protein
MYLSKKVGRMTLSAIYRTQQMLATIVYAGQKMKLDVKEHLFDGVGKYMNVQQFKDRCNQLLANSTTSRSSTNSITMNSKDRNFCYYLLNYGRTTYQEHFDSDTDVITRKLYTGKVRKIIKKVITALRNNSMEPEYKMTKNLDDRSSEDGESEQNHVKLTILI